MSDSLNQVTSSDAVTMDENHFKLLDMLQVVADNIRLLVLGSLLIGLLSLGASFIVAPTFSSKTQIIPPKQQQSGVASALADLSGLGGAAGGIAGVKNPADQYASILKSKSIADALVDQFNLLDRYDEKYRIDAIKELADNTRILVGAKDGLISIEFDDKDAQTSADIANAYVGELRKVLNRLALTESQQRRVFFERMVAETKTNLVKAEIALKASGVDSSALKLSATASLEGLARLRAQISVQEVKLATMLGYLADTAPEFRLAQNELAALKTELRKADKEDGATGGQSDYVARFREFKYQEALMELYLKQFEVARLDEGREGAVIQVVDAAQKPERKSKPKKGFVAVIATLGGAVLMLLFIFTRHFMQDASKDPILRKKILQLRQTLNASLIHH